MSPRLLIVFCLLTWLAVALAAWRALGHSSTDVLHGVYVKMLYLHVPFAYTTTIIYAALTISSISTLILPQSARTDRISLSLAPIGAWVTAVTLFTGSFWGRYAWGTWWAWDARLTSVLVLFITYLAYVGLRWGIIDKQKSRIPAAIFVIIGAINVPIVKFSVNWWNTVHQPTSIFNPNGISIHQDFRFPLLFMALALSFLLVVWFVIRYKVLGEEACLADKILDSRIKQQADEVQSNQTSSF